MINPDKLAAVFRTMLGWPYVSPGYSDSRGIDCSGAFVYAYRQFNQRIYHGSNRIIRTYCHDVKNIANISQLRVGMAIFKARTDTSRMKAEYKPGGQYYNADLPYDYYHVGLITSVSPLQIINATPPSVRIDTVLFKWCCAGYLNAVEYSDAISPPTPPDPEPEKQTAVTVATSGSTVNLRSQPRRTAAVLVRVPLGHEVTVLEKPAGDWWRVRYEKYTGYMMHEFLQLNE